MLSTFIKLPFVIDIFVLCIFLSGRLRQVLLYHIKYNKHHGNAAFLSKTQDEILVTVQKNLTFKINFQFMGHPQSAEPDQIPHSAASDQVLRCLLIECYFKTWIKFWLTT